MKQINVTDFDTPIGKMYACATDKGICSLGFTGDKPALVRNLSLFSSNFNKMPVTQSESPFFAPLREQMEAYFAGSLREFDIPLHMDGSDFQMMAWNAMRAIPYGSTWSYAEQAAHIGRPAAVRAVANANRMNHIAIIIPCHRVIGSNGTLTGYAGGLWRKEFLINLERQSAGTPK